MSNETGVGRETADTADDAAIKVEFEEELEGIQDPLEVSHSNSSVVESSGSFTEKIGEIPALHGSLGNPCSEAVAHERNQYEETEWMATAVTTAADWCPDSLEAVFDDESNYYYPCLICYNEVFKTECVDNEDLECELYDVFCKYMQIQRSSDHKVENQLFCNQCAVNMRTLLQLDAELETLRLKTDKVVMDCTAALLESYHPGVRTFRNRLVDTIRSQIFSRYNPRVSIGDRTIAEDDYREPSLVESEMDIGGGPTDDEGTMNDPCDNELVVLSDAEPEVDPLDVGSQISLSPRNTRNGLLARSAAIRAKEQISAPPHKVYSNPPPMKTRKGRPYRKQCHDTSTKKIELVTLREAKQSLQSGQTDEKPVTLKVPGTDLKYQKISPGSYTYARRFIFEDFGASKFKCRHCCRAYPSVEEMIFHIQRSHIGRKPKNRDDPDDVIYVNYYRVERRKGIWYCKECDFDTKSKKLVKKHVSSEHYIRNTETSIPGAPTTADDSHSADTATSAETSGPTVTTDPTSAEGGAEQSENPSACTVGNNSDENYAESEDTSEGEEEDGEMDPDYQPEDVITKTEVKRRKSVRQERPSKLKQVGPGKYIYGEKFEFEKTEEETWSCGTCGKRVKTWSEIYHHVRGHYFRRDEANKNLKMVDYGENQFLYAKKFIIDKLGDQLSCHECGFLHKDKAVMQLHIRRTHMNRDPCMCEECGKIFSDSLALKSHVDRMHVETMEVCPTCGKSCRNAVVLRTHVRNVHQKDRSRSKKRNFICEHCGKAFDSRVKLVSHSSSHTGEKPFQCQYCLQSFGAYNAMVTHRKHQCEKNPKKS